MFFGGKTRIRDSQVGFGIQVSSSNEALAIEYSVGIEFYEF